MYYGLHDFALKAQTVARMRKVSTLCRAARMQWHVVQWLWAGRDQSPGNTPALWMCPGIFRHVLGLLWCRGQSERSDNRWWSDWAERERRSSMLVSVLFILPNYNSIKIVLIFFSPHCLQYFLFLLFILLYFVPGIKSRVSNLETIKVNF